MIFLKTVRISLLISMASSESHLSYHILRSVDRACPSAFKQKNIKYELFENVKNANGLIGMVSSWYKYSATTTLKSNQPRPVAFNKT